MSTNYVDEYMIKLGAAVDASGMAHFQQALREASMIADVSFASIAGAAFKAQTEIVGGFLAIGSAALGLVDKVAMSDQSFRLFALHMYMSKESARGLKVAMDALGEPLENLTWDPELRARTAQLLKDQRAMAPDGDFEAQMRKIRDIRFEFTRMEVEGEYLAMHVVEDFMKALGMGPDDILNKLKGFNDWVTHSLPQISQRLVSDFLPVWNDVVHIMKDAWQVGLDLGQAFTNVMAVLSGDQALAGTITLEKFAGSVEKLVHWLSLVSDFLLKITGLLAGGLVGGTVGGLLGSIIGGIAGLAGGFAGVAAGALGGGALGTAIGTGIGAVGGGAFDVYRAYNPAGGGGNSGDTVALAQRVSAMTGIRPDLLWSQWAHETGGFTHMGAANNLAGIKIPGTDTYQSFSSLDDFGKRYAEVVGNAHRYAGLSGATSPAEFAHILKTGGYYADSEANYAGGMGRYERMYNGPVTINVTQRPGENGAELASRIKGELTATANKRTQRNLMTVQDLSPSY